MRYRIAYKKEAGFSAMELLVSVAIGGLLLAAITTSFISQSRSYNAQEKVSEMQQTARAVMDIMTREIRMAGYDPSDNGFNGIAVCNATTLQVLADLDGDGDTTAATEPDENLTYTYDATNKLIQRNSGSGNQTVAGDILLFSFGCLDASGNATTTPADVRLIKIDLTAETYAVDPGYTLDGGRRRYTLTSMVKPRNLTD